MKQIIIEPSSRANLNNISKLEEIIYLGCSANQEILITTRSYLSNSQKSPGSAISAKSKNKKEKSYNLYFEIDNILVLFNTIKEKLNISYFQLLKNIEDYWFVPIKGSSAFALYRNFALFNGGYRDYENFYLVKLEKNHQAKIVCQIKLKNISEISYIFAKGDTLYFLSNREIFQLSVFEVMTNLNS